MGAIAGETRSPARVAGEGPRATVKKNVPFTVGRGPVPRHAIGRETALAGVRFSRGSNDRGGQAPAIRARETALPCAVRDQALPNYSHWGTLANAEACLPRRGGWVLCGQKNSTSKENSNVIYWFLSENFMGYLLKCYWFSMLGSPIS